MLLFLPGSARLRAATPDLTIRLVLQDRVLTATTRRTLSDTALVNPGAGLTPCSAKCTAAPAKLTSDLLHAIYGPVASSPADTAIDLRF